MTEYREIREEQVIPSADLIVWTTPRRNAGQIIEVSYSRGIPGGTVSARTNRIVNMEADEGDLYRRTVDHSDGTVYYAKRVIPSHADN